MVSVTVRRAAESDFDWILDTAVQAGWNPGFHDARAFQAQDPEGFLVAEGGGVRLGCLSAIRYGSGFGFLGGVLAGAEAGTSDVVGKMTEALFSCGVERLEGRTVGMDVPPENEEAFTESGFRRDCELLRYEFCNSLSGAPLPEGTNFPVICPSLAVSVTQTDCLADLLLFDCRIFGCSRADFLRYWLSMPGAPVAAACEGGEMRGYAVARPCKKGYTVGPLFAEDAAAAERIFRAVCSRLPGGLPVYLTIPASNERGMKMALMLNMEPVERLTRIVRGRGGELDSERVFGVTTLRLG